MPTRNPILPKAILFDMDGTLFDTERLGMTAWIDTFRILEIDMPLEAIRKTVGCDPTEKYRIFLAHAPNREAAAIDPVLVTKTWKDCFLSLLRTTGIPVKPGVRETLALLRELGIPAAVASSSPTAMASFLLQGSGLLSFFRTVVGGDDVPRPKPAPDPYLEAARRLEIQPSRAWAIEDSSQGLRSAGAAGIPAILIPDAQPETATHQEFSWIRLESMTDLFLLLRQATRKLAPATA